jgi:hypothetical protein
MVLTVDIDSCPSYAFPATGHESRPGMQNQQMPTRERIALLSGILRDQSATSIWGRPEVRELIKSTGQLIRTTDRLMQGVCSDAELNREITANLAAMARHTGQVRPTHIAWTLQIDCRQAHRYQESLAISNRWKCPFATRHC